MNIHSKLIKRELMKVKSRIGEIRKSKGLQQSFIAKQLGISQQQLSDWERGKAYPRIDRANKLAKVLNVDVKELYEWDTEQPDS